MRGMEVVGNQIMRDGVAVAMFDENWEKTYLATDLDKPDKMAIGSLITKERKRAEKSLTVSGIPDEPIATSAPRQDDAPKPVQATEKAPEAPKANEDASIAPWDIWPDCPKPGPDGDKTVEVVEWLYANKPDYYKRRYSQRKTCVESRLANERRSWMDMGEDYAIRGMHITDCPRYASEQQREYFRAGYRRYLEQTANA